MYGTKEVKSLPGWGSPSHQVCRGWSLRVYCMSCFQRCFIRSSLCFLTLAWQFVMVCWFYTVLVLVWPKD